MASCAPSALHAETSNAELAKEIAELKAQIRELRGAVSVTRSEARRTDAKVRAVAERRPAYALPPPGAPYPVGAIPAFVTADKKLQFGAITITPGGFAAMESRYSTRTEQADIGSAYQNIPFGPLAGTSELRLTARQSRVSALLEAPITPNFFVSGYGEFDFLGSGATSNYNESNSYVPRIRHLYAALDVGDYGLHVLAGQNWSLATLNSKGITPRNEITPPTIDAQYVPGFVWKRQAQIRVTKDFDKRLWVALSAESPQNLFSNCVAGVNGTAPTPAPGGAVTGVTCDIPGNNNLNGITNFSLNHVPDVIGKVAYEAQFADRDIHLEGFGIYRDIYDRVSIPGAGTAFNTNTPGYGVGGGLIAPIIPKRLDFQVSGLWGRGIGSYGTSQFSDATINASGAGSAVPEHMVLAGLTLHATPSIDVYAFGGFEQVERDFYATNAAGTAFAGYGVPTADNTGCFDDVVAAACDGKSKRVWQITGGFWDKIYKGSFGEVRGGVQYSYTKRELFSGDGGGGPFYTPRQDDQSVLTSLRYYPFQ